jgi:hypothetical protein
LKTYLYDTQSHLKDSKDTVTSLLAQVPSEFKSKFYSLTILLLLKLITEDTKVTLNQDDISSKIFEIENPEFKTAQKLLSMIMKGENPIRMITHMVMQVNYIDSFERRTYTDLSEKVSEYLTTCLVYLTSLIIFILV